MYLIHIRNELSTLLITIQEVPKGRDRLLQQCYYFGQLFRLLGCRLAVLPLVFRGSVQSWPCCCYDILECLGCLLPSTLQIGRFFFF